MTHVRTKNAMDLNYCEGEEMDSLVVPGEDGGMATPSPAQTHQHQPELGRMHRIAATVILLLLIIACAGFVRKADTIPLDLTETNLRIKGNDQSFLPQTNDDMTKMICLQANGAVYNVTKQVAEQIMNYRRGTGLILNLHITHHGGTTLCATIGRSPAGSAPVFACMKEKGIEKKTNYSFPKRAPWQRNETSAMISNVRKHYHMISWEYGYFNKIPDPALSATKWEDPNLFSILVVRDPISRLLAGSGWTNHHLPDIPRGNASLEDWWTYAKHPWLTNNYALRVLGGGRIGECCDGANTDPKYLENAKALVRRVSVVLDIECLSEGIEAVARLLNITLANPGKLHQKSNHHAPSRQRIGHDDIYEYLLEKNRLDIELYEWSKNRALVNCARI